MSEEATTVGGLLTEQLGRLPAVADTVAIGGDTFEVLEIRRHIATSVRIRPEAPQETVEAFSVEAARDDR